MLSGLLLVGMGEVQPAKGETLGFGPCSFRKSMNLVLPRAWGITFTLHSCVFILLLGNFRLVSFILSLLLLVLLLVSPTLGVQLLAVIVQYTSSKPWGSYYSRLLALCDLLAL